MKPKQNQTTTSILQAGPLGFRPELTSSGKKLLLIVVAMIVALTACGGDIPSADGDLDGDSLKCGEFMVPTTGLEDLDGDGEITTEDCPSPDDLKDRFVDCDADGTYETLIADLEDVNGDGVVDEGDCPDDPGDQGADCDPTDIRGTLSELRDNPTGTVPKVTLKNCRLDTECGPLELVLDDDGDGLSNGFERFMGDETGGRSSPCEPDSDKDGIMDGLDLLRSDKSLVRVNMAVRRYEQNTDWHGEMDDPGDGDPYFWGGSWLAAGDSSHVNLRFNRFHFDHHIEDVDEWNEHEDEDWNGPEYLEKPVELSADVTDWITDARPRPSLQGSLVVIDHDGSGGGDGRTGSCDAELYLPGEPEIYNCHDTNGNGTPDEPDPTGLYPPSYGALLLDLVNLLGAIQSGSVVGDALPKSSSVEALDGNGGLVFPLYNLSDPKLRLDIWVRVEDGSGNPISPCAVTTALQANKLLAAGDFLLPEAWDSSCTA